MTHAVRHTRLPVAPWLEHLPAVRKAMLGSTHVRGTQLFSLSRARVMTDITSFSTFITAGTFIGASDS